VVIQHQPAGIGQCPTAGADELPLSLGRAHFVGAVEIGQDHIRAGVGQVIHGQTGIGHGDLEAVGFRQ
jgi:hypothetical protein